MRRTYDEKRRFMIKGLKNLDFKVALIDALPFLESPSRPSAL
jgi:hypothetical protein